MNWKALILAICAVWISSSLCATPASLCASPSSSPSISYLSVSTGADYQCPISRNASAPKASFRSVNVSFMASFSGQSARLFSPFNSDATPSNEPVIARRRLTSDDDDDDDWGTGGTGYMDNPGDEGEAYSPVGSPFILALFALFYAFFSCIKKRDND